MFYIWITIKKTCSTGDESIRKLNAIVYYEIKDLEDELMYKRTNDERWKMFDTMLWPITLFEKFAFREMLI